MEKKGNPRGRRTGKIELQSVNSLAEASENVPRAFENAFPLNVSV